MQYKYEIRREAKKFLEKIPVDDKRKIIEKIESLTKDPHQSGVIKLVNIHPPKYRVRQGNYRIIFIEEKNILLIEVIRIFIRGDEY